MATRTDPRGALGHLGEELAARHLRGQGMQILARCAHTAAGEVDLVAYADGTIVFVEVKTRRVRARAATERDPLESIGPRKRARLRRAGAAWLSEHRERPHARTIRFDAIGVTIDAAGRALALEHVRDAF
jgi:putative endonuclease